MVVAVGHNILEVSVPHIRGQRSPQLVVAVCHNIFEVTETPIRGQRPPQFLVPEGTRFYKSQMIT